MPRATQQRTFTACWTCRRRNIRCDAAVPRCSQCRRSHIPCEGYHFNLVWVDAATGDYSPHQRRAFPCHLTWKGHPIWTSREVDHLIRDCEYKRQYRCSWHHGTSPFSAFPQAAATLPPARGRLPKSGAEDRRYRRHPPSPRLRPLSCSSNPFRKRHFRYMRGT
jgi:hypothetical protein